MTAKAKHPGKALGRLTVIKKPVDNGTPRGNLTEAYLPTAKDREAVYTMSAYGIPHEMIAHILNVSPNTLRKHFARELSVAASEKSSKVAGSLYDAAIKGNVTAQIFWLKSRARWREHGEPETKPYAPPLDWSKLSVEEIKVLHKLVKKASAAPEGSTTPQHP